MDFRMPGFSSDDETAIRDLLAGLLLRFGAAVKVWPAACLGLRGPGDPAEFIAEQWDALCADLQTLRWQYAAAEQPSPAFHDQVIRLMQTCADLREVFDTLLEFRAIAEQELDAALLRLQTVWQQARMRVSFLTVLVPLPLPLPALTIEQEAHYQSVLDGLCDRFDAARGELASQSRNELPAPVRRAA